ncbi:MAG: hypothetical protein AAFN63_18580 [Pseudomonadota bacterium]
MDLLILTSLPGAYFNALLACFFVLLIKEQGLVVSPLKFFGIFWPVLKPLLLGFFPAAVIGLLVLQLGPSQNIVYYTILISFGLFVSAALFHRYLLTKFHKMVVWHLLIMVLIFLQLALFSILP